MKYEPPPTYKELAGYIRQPDGSWWHPDDFLGSGKRPDDYFTDLNDAITAPLSGLGLPWWSTYALLAGGSFFLIRRVF